MPKNNNKPQRNITLKDGIVIHESFLDLIQVIDRHSGANQTIVRRTGRKASKPKSIA